MTIIEERVAALEQLFQQGREEHKDIADTLEKLTAHVSKLEVYLANGNGGLTLSVRDKRVKFAGSLALPWSVAVVAVSGAQVLPLVLVELVLVLVGRYGYGIGKGR